MKLQTLLILALLSLAVAQDRKIASVINPGCEDCSVNTTLVYVKCEGASDTIHQIWDFTRSIPTVIFAVAGVNSTLNITWVRNYPMTFELSEAPSYSFAVALDKLYEYDDLDDKGYFDPKMPHHIYELDHLVWHRTASSTTDKEAMVQLYSNLYNEKSSEYGTVWIKLDLLPYKDYAVELPHLIHTANTTLFDVSLANLTQSCGYNASRYAVHLLLASTDPATQTMHFNMRKVLDDKHTPGIFEVIEIKTPALYDEGEGGYLQFRPVGYVEPERGVASSTVAHVSFFKRTTLPRQSTLKTFYDEYAKANLLVQDMVVSFGEGGDGYYAQHNYTAWSFTVGYGIPPQDDVSVFRVLLATMGVIMTIILLTAGIILFWQRRLSPHRARFENEN